MLELKNPPAKSGDLRDAGLIPEWGRSPGGGMGNPLQDSCWRIRWTEEPSRLQSIGSHRVGHDWSDLAHTQDPCSMGSSVHWRIFSSIQMPVTFPYLWQSKISPENDKCDLRRQNDSWLRIHVPQVFVVVQSLSRVQLFATPWTAEHARLPCRSPSPRACPDSGPLSQSCHPTILSSATGIGVHNPVGGNFVSRDK